MAIDKKRILIDFFSEGLSEEDKKEFLELASSDPDFLRSFIKITEFNSLIEKGDFFIDSKRTSPKKKNQRSFVKISVTVTAVAAVIIVAVFLVFFNKPVISANDLFSRYYSPKDILIPRGSAPENFPLEITEAYENGRYSDLSLIKKEKVTFKGKNLVYLIVGISDIEMKNYSKADSDLRAVSSSNEYYSYACWYLALLNIKDKEYAKARAYLDIVKENNLNFLEKANSLLSELDKLSIHGSSKLK